MHWGGLGAVFCPDVVAYVDMRSTSFTQIENQASRLPMIVQNGSELAETAPATHILEYVAFLRPCHSLHLSTNAEYWWKVVLFEQRFPVWRNASLFVNW